MAVTRVCKVCCAKGTTDKMILIGRYAWVHEECRGKHVAHSRLLRRSSRRRRSS